MHLEGDSMNVTRAIDQRMEGHSPIHLLYDKLYSYVSSLEGFCCSFVSRGGNSLAHSIARWDTRLANEKICMDPFPQELFSLDRA